jgi:hypothetical protein
VLQAFLLEIPVQAALDFSIADVNLFGPSPKIMPMRAQISRRRLTSLDRGALHHRCSDAAVLRPPNLEFFVRKAYFDFA